MKVHGMKFASLGPFKVVFEPVTFQRLCPVSMAVKEGKLRLLRQVRSNLLPLPPGCRKSPSACLVHLVCSVCLVCIVYLVEPD